MSTGKFGDIGLGSKMDDALKLLGNPVQHSKMDKPEKVDVLYYNRFSANLGSQGSLYAMSLQFNDYSEPLPDTFQIEGPALTEKTTHEEIEAFLKEAGIKYESDVTDYSVTLKTASNVEISTVKNDESGKFLLQSIGITDFAYMWK